MKHFLKSGFIFFLITFFIINLVQSAYTGLLEDEAYYWVWSKDLAWGYFDHPPLVALWIWLGDRFFSGELGVRFFSTISFSAMLILIWETIEVKQKNRFVWLYFLLVVSVAMLNLYGFISTPDTPLLFFASVFLFFYQGFLRNTSLFNSLGLGFAMAGMLYAKYHGILVIVFIVLSNIKLLRNKRFWLASGFALLLFIPHLIWQYRHDFITFRYHLFERGGNAYRLEFSLMHFVNQIAIVGITFPLIYYAFFKEKSRDIFDKGMKYLVYGFIVFFFFGSFKSATQAQWTIVILIPLLFFSFRYFVKHPKARRWLVYVGLVQLLILLTGRVFLARADWSPVVLETHKPGIWVDTLRKKTQSKPVVFIRYAYRDASVYNFYTGIKTHAYSTLYGRRSQYDLGDFEKNMQHESVAVVSLSKIGKPIELHDGKKRYRKDIDDFTTYQKLRIKVKTSDKTIKFTPGTEKTVELVIENPYRETVTFDSAEIVGFLRNKKPNRYLQIPVEYEKIRPIKPGESRRIEVKFRVPEFDYNSETQFRFGLTFYGLDPGYQGTPLKVKITD